MRDENSHHLMRDEARNSLLGLGYPASEALAALTMATATGHATLRWHRLGYVGAYYYITSRSAAEDGTFDATGARRELGRLGYSDQEITQVVGVATDTGSAILRSHKVTRGHLGRFTIQPVLPAATVQFAPVPPQPETSLSEEQLAAVLRVYLVDNDSSAESQAAAIFRKYQVITSELARKDQWVTGELYGYRVDTPLLSPDKGQPIWCAWIRRPNGWYSLPDNRHFADGELSTGEFRRISFEETT